MKVIAFFISILLVIPSQADSIDIFDYVEPDNLSKVFNYTSTTESNMYSPGWNAKGKLIQTPVSNSKVDGVQTLIVNNQFKDLPDFPTDYQTRYMQRLDGYYSAYADSAGKIEEHLILPSGVQVGSVWKTSKFWDTEQLESIVNFESPAGVYQNCLQIKREASNRTEMSNKAGERQQAIAIVCPDIGFVSTTTTNIINAVQFKTVTTIELISTARH